MKNYGLFTIQYLLKQTLGNFLFQILKFQYNVKVNEKIIVLNCRNSTEVFAHNEISEIENVYGQEIKDLFFLIRFANSFLKININLYVTKSISVLLQQGLYRKQTDPFFSLNAHQKLCVALISFSFTFIRFVVMRNTQQVCA